MHRSNKLASINIVELLLDVLFLFLSYFISYLISSQIKHLYSIWDYSWILLLFVPIWLLIMGSFGMYQKYTFNYYDRILRNILVTSLVSCMFTASFMFFIKETMFSRVLFSTFVITCMVLHISQRFLYVYFTNKRRNNKTKNIIIVGDRDIAFKFIYFILKTSIKINIIGYVNVNDDKHHHFNSKKALGNIEDLENILKGMVVDEVVFALPKTYVGEVEKYVHICEVMGITAKIILDLYDLKIAKTHFSSVGTLPVLTYHSVSLNDFELLLKRTMDIIGAVIGLTLTGIASLFIIPAIKVASPGPVLFKQDRVGVNGRVFKIYKFRTMYMDAEERKKELMAQNQVKGGLMFKMKSDPRITPIGKILRKTSLDELPQFINVLKGEMSLVGTRPPTIDEVKNYETYHHRRISFKPGLTGMWQVSGRSNITDFEDVVRLDTQYIDRWSIWLDVIIVFKTIWVVLKRGDAY